MKGKPNRKWKISHTFIERRTMCFSSYKNRKLIAFFVPFILSEGNFFDSFISIYSVLNTLSEYTYFYISKNIT